MRGTGAAAYIHAIFSQVPQVISTWLLSDWKQRFKTGAAKTLNHVGIALLKCPAESLAKLLLQLERGVLDLPNVLLLLNRKCYRFG